MSKSQRRKGAEGERQARDVLRPAFPDVRRRCSGEEVQDARRGRDLENTPGWCVQVQLAKVPTPEKKLLEAFNARAHGEVPVALTRRSSAQVKGGAPPGQWLATLPAADFAELVRQRDKYVADLREALELAERLKNPFEGS